MLTIEYVQCNAHHMRMCAECIYTGNIADYRQALKKKKKPGPGPSWPMPGYATDFYTKTPGSKQEYIMYSCSKATLGLYIVCMQTIVILNRFHCHHAC